jgi:hypothetical protein
MAPQTDSSEDRSPAPLRRFLHDLAAPLSAVALHLETAVRRVKQGNDPSEALATAQRELEKAFGMFESGRTKLLETVPGSKNQP